MNPTVANISSGQKSMEHDLNESTSLQSEFIDLLNEVMDIENGPIMLVIRENSNEHLVDQIILKSKNIKIIDISKDAIQDAFNAIIKRVHEKALQTKIRVSFWN